MLGEFGRWLDTGRRLELAWLAFAVVNLAAMVWMIAARALDGWETVPFHFIYVSFTLLYGFRAWRLRGTLMGLAFVIVSTGVLTLWATVVGWEAVPELTEIPLMALMFAAMVFHVRRRQQATAVAEALAAARAADLERQRLFVSDASHELLTPITIARGHMDILRRIRHPEPADITEAHDVVTAELDRMTRLINRLLVIERAASLGPDDRVPVDMRAMLTELHQRWQGTADREWCLGPLAAGRITVDADQLMLALDALVENAVQHTGPGDEISLVEQRRRRSARDPRAGRRQRDSARRGPAYLRPVLPRRPVTQPAAGRVGAWPLHRPRGGTCPRRRRPRPRAGGRRCRVPRDAARAAVSRG